MEQNVGANSKIIDLFAANPIKESGMKGLSKFKAVCKAITPPIKKEIKICPCGKLCPTEKNDNIIRIAHSRVLYCHKHKLNEEYNIALKNYHLLFNNYSNNYSSDFFLLI